MSKSLPTDHAWELYGEEKFSETINEGKKYFDDPTNEVKIDAHKVVALAYFQLKDFKTACPMFVKLAEETGNPDDWFNVLTSSAMCHDIALAEKAYKHIETFHHKDGSGQHIPLPQVWYYYMQALRDVKEYSRAFEMLKKLGNYYKQLGITDTHFVYMRGAPFLEHSLSAAEIILKNIPARDAAEFLDDLKSSLDDDGKDLVEEKKRSLAL